MQQVAVAPPRAARASVFAIFGINGFLLAMWVVHIPTITDRTGVSDAILGMLILLLAVGAIAGMQLAGPLADRFGSRRLVATGATLVSLSILGPGSATDAAQLGIALAILGFTNGALDVSMNSQAVHVERMYGRPIMSSFHALFSCGGLVGSLLGAVTLHAGWDVRVTMLTATTIGLITTAVCSRNLLARTHHQQAEITPAAHPQLTRKVLTLGAIAFALLMAEGVANDWSTLQVRDHLGVADSTAALAFGTFSFAMTAGRFAADRVAGAFGPVAVVRYGTLIAAAGVLLVIASPWVATALLGWALFGLGLSGGIPQIFTAAGNLHSGAAGATMSRVFGMGYIGFLAGPAIIGWTTKLVSLTAAMTLPLIAVLLACLFAGVVAPRAQR